MVAQKRCSHLVVSAMVAVCFLVVCTPTTARTEPPGTASPEAGTEAPGAASIPPGTVIDAKNVASFGYLGGPGLRWSVERGVKLKVGAYRKVGNPRPFVEATQKYASRVKLSEDGKSLVDHVAGLPFPTIDPGDPMIARKLVLNFEAAVARDDLDVRNFECRVRSFGGTPDGDVSYLVDHFRRLYFRERTVVEPFPERPDNQDKVRYKEMLGPIIEPFDHKGVGWVQNRYIDASRQDDTWLYMPQLRRVRRISQAQRSVPYGKQDIDYDSTAGFSGNGAWFDWRYIGEKTILATFHDATIPVAWSEAPGDFVHTGSWEPRKVWLVEGTTKVPEYSYSKRVLYIDRDTFRIPYSDLYDPAGQLAKVWISSFLFARAPNANATHRFDYDVPYEPSVTMLDLQQPGATFCEMPSRRFPDEEGWYVNRGDKDGMTEGVFDLSVRIAPGR